MVFSGASWRGGNEGEAGGFGTRPLRCLARAWGAHRSALQEGAFHIILQVEQFWRVEGFLGERGEAGTSS